jgi:phenylacetate-CoA ligase
MDDRYPGLSERGRLLLASLREHPAAPIFRNQSGHRLLPEEVQELRGYADHVRDAMVDPRASFAQPWLRDYVQAALTQVPHYRRYGSMPERLQDLPTITRADLARDIAQFVPDQLSTDRLINFRTTGLTGNPLLIASHPLVAGRYLAFHQRALKRFGIALQSGAGDVGVMLVGWQQKCFTYVSVTPQLDECGLVKINLHESDWRDPAHRSAYIDALKPEVITGDPLSFAALLALEVEHRPRALMSTSMTLLPGMRAALEQRFGCPVLDLYSLNEAGPIGVYDPQLDGHVLLQPAMAIEILDDAGEPVAAGERGEITLTGGFNFCTPLLRYRTGDFGALELRGSEWLISGLAGRAPVRFRRPDGNWINNIDVTHALKPCALAQYALWQRADASLQLDLYGATAPDAAAAVSALHELFGAGVELHARSHAAPVDKVVQYRTDLTEA